MARATGKQMMAVSSRSMSKTKIPFVDIASQRKRLAGRIDSVIARVLEHGQFILGPEVATLEQELETFTGARHCVTCANGTDALTLVMMAEGIGPGDAVIVPSFTFVATAEAVVQIGAVPVFADVNSDSFNIDTASALRAIHIAETKRLQPRAIIAVDLFGQPANYKGLAEVASAKNLLLIADAAQSLGATTAAGKVGTLGDYTTTSFFPAKPLGCYGDGGAVFVDDESKADLLRSLRFHGMGKEKYDNVRVGLNSRLDTLQAAILLEKLSIFAEELRARKAIAERYTQKLKEHFQAPVLGAGNTSSWAQYTLLCADEMQRDVTRQNCANAGIPTAVYYPIPLHLQSGYRNFPADTNGLPISEKLSKTVLSLPMHAYLEESVQDQICQSVIAGLGNRSVG